MATWIFREPRVFLSALYALCRQTLLRLPTKVLFNADNTEARETAVQGWQSPCSALAVCAIYRSRLLSDDQHDERVRQHLVVRGAVPVPRCDDQHVVRFRIHGHCPRARLRVNFFEHLETI